MANLNIRFATVILLLKELKKSITITKNTTFARNQAEKAVKKKVEEQLETIRTIFVHSYHL